MVTLSNVPYYGGGQVANPANALYGTTAPNSADVQHNIGTIYVNTSNSNIYVLTSKAGGTATWTQANGGGGVTDPLIVGNFTIDGTTNDISVTDTNGNITLSPNGSGELLTGDLSFSGRTITTTTTDGDVIINPNGSGAVSIANVAISGVNVVGNSAGNDLVLSAPGGQAVSVPNNAFTCGQEIISQSSVSITLGDFVTTDGNMWFQGVGTGLQFAPGGRCGVVALVAGTATVSGIGPLTTNSLIQISRFAVAGSTALGELSVGTIDTVGNSFVINALDPSDASTLITGDASQVMYHVIESRGIG